MKIVRPCELIAFIAVFLTPSKGVGPLNGCEEDYTNEALTSFENCATASEDTVYRRIRDENDEQRPNIICNIVNTLYSDCTAQYLSLEKCVGYENEGGMAEIVQSRLFSIREILRLTYAYQNIDFSKCEMFHHVDIYSHRFATSNPPPTISGIKENQN